MKCCYDPEIESDGTCVNCRVPLCKTCLTDADLSDGLCLACNRQKKTFRFFGYFRIGMCSLGMVWLALSFLVIFPGNMTNGFTYGLLGLLGAFALNTVAAQIIQRSTFWGLKPEQRAFVLLHRYSVSGNKMYFNQAMRALKKIEDMTPFKDALFDNIVSILIYLPYDLPADWIEFLSENFNMTDKELLDGILEFGIDVFEENIFNNHIYQAIEPSIEILKRTDNEKMYHVLVDRILDRLKGIDFKAVSRPSAYVIPGMPQQQSQQEPPSVIRDRAFLTELKMIDAELEDFLTRTKRDSDWKAIADIINNYELPKVPKSTFEAAKAMAARTQQQMKGPDGIAGTEDDTGDPSKVKICAECGISFSEEHLKAYIFRDISVNVCSECYSTLEKEGHREPRLLASIRKPKEYKKLVEEAEEDKE
ncbi:MAG: hypothetical protein FK732_02255 [Asgard group archaeon]|nr:hypothetical protein [Asgard group archaeon]